MKENKYPKYPNQPDSISFGNLYIKYREDPDFVGEIKYHVLFVLENLVNGKAGQRRDFNVDDLSNVFYGGPMGIIAHSKDPSGEVINFTNIRDVTLNDLWNLHIDIRNWQNDPLPAEFLKHSVSDKQILREIFEEMNYFKRWRIHEYTVTWIPTEIQ